MNDEEEGWEVVWSPDEPAPDPVHRIVIVDGFMTFECHAATNWPCHAVYDCDCEEWFASGVEGGVPWHEPEAFSSRERHFGRFDPRECNARDWIEGDSDPIECQARGTDGRVVIPVEVYWTGHGMEWKPAKGGAR